MAEDRGRLAGRRILVVGAGTRPSADPDAPVGNGRAIAVLAAREGAVVACADLDADAAAATVAMIETGGGHAVCLIGDVRDPDVCQAFVVDAADRLGGLDGLVANVGIGAGGNLAGTSTADWDLVLQVNVRAHAQLAAAALDTMSDGSIVLIGSIAGRRAGSRLPAYDVSKAGIEALARHTAREGARRGIRCNVVVPGLIDTPLGGSRPRADPPGRSRPFRSAGRERRGRWPQRRSSSCLTTPPTSPGRTSWSTAASRP